MEVLADALLDFQALADPASWLAANAAPVSEALADHDARPQRCPQSRLTIPADSACADPMSYGGWNCSTMEVARERAQHS